MSTGVTLDWIDESDFLVIAQGVLAEARVPGSFSYGHEGRIELGVHSKSTMDFGKSNFPVGNRLLLLRDCLFDKSFLCNVKNIPAHDLSCDSCCNLALGRNDD